MVDLEAVQTVPTFDDLLALGMDQTLQLKVGERILVGDTGTVYVYLGSPSYSPKSWSPAPEHRERPEGDTGE